MSPSTTIWSPAPSSMTSSSTLVGGQRAVAGRPAHRRLGLPDDRELVEGLLRPQFLDDADPAVGDDEHTEQAIDQLSCGQHDEKQHAQDGVDAGEHVGPDDVCRHCARPGKGRRWLPSATRVATSASVRPVKLTCSSGNLPICRRRSTPASACRRRTSRWKWFRAGAFSVMKPNVNTSPSQCVSAIGVRPRAQRHGELAVLFGHRGGSPVVVPVGADVGRRRLGRAGLPAASGRPGHPSGSSISAAPAVKLAPVLTHLTELDQIGELSGGLPGMPEGVASVSATIADVFAEGMMTKFGAQPQSEGLPSG